MDLLRENSITEYCYTINFLSYSGSNLECEAESCRTCLASMSGHFSLITQLRLQNGKEITFFSAKEEKVDDERLNTYYLCVIYSSL